MCKQAKPMDANAEQLFIGISCFRQLAQVLESSAIIFEKLISIVYAISFHSGAASGGSAQIPFLFNFVSADTTESITKD